MPIPQVAFNAVQWCFMPVIHSPPRVYAPFISIVFVCIVRTYGNSIMFFLFYSHFVPIEPPSLVSSTTPLKIPVKELIQLRYPR